MFVIVHSHKQFLSDYHRSSLTSIFHVKDSMLKTTNQHDSQFPWREFQIWNTLYLFVVNIVLISIKFVQWKKEKWFVKMVFSCCFCVCVFTGVLSFICMVKFYCTDFTIATYEFNRIETHQKNYLDNILASTITYTLFDIRATICPPLFYCTEHMTYFTYNKFNGRLIQLE